MGLYFPVLNEGDPQGFIYGVACGDPLGSQYVVEVNEGCRGSFHCTVSADDGTVLSWCDVVSKALALKDQSPPE